MKISRSEPGLALSAAVHFGLLALLLVHFSREHKFDDAQEAVPVETISDAQFSQIMKGEKTAKEVAPKPKAERVAEQEELKPTPPTPKARTEVAPPPPPKIPDPSEAEAPPPTPPVRPVTPKVEPKPEPKPPLKVEEKEEPDDPEAEPVKPPPRPKPPEKKAETKPEPTPPKPPEKPTPKPDFKALAKLLAETKDAKPSEKPSKPKSGEDSNARPSPNLVELKKFLSHEPAQSQGSAGHEISHTASLGTASGHAAKMSVTMGDAFDSLLRERYKQCWNYLSFSDTPRYVPRIKIAFRPDGSLAATPVLLNPPGDPSARALADSALRAVRSCDPMKIPAQFAPYYDQWKDSTVAFNPQQ